MPNKPVWHDKFEQVTGLRLEYIECINHLNSDQTNICTRSEYHLMSPTGVPLIRLSGYHHSDYLSYSYVADGFEEIAHSE